MNTPDRSKYILDFIREGAAANGGIDAVDEDYHGAFHDLTQQQIEKLAVAVMLD